MGSSATTTTIPPLAPVMEAFMNGSAATFKPTCFMQTMERLPAYDMPMADSMAVFSLPAQMLCTSPARPCLEFWINSVISVEGVPGYAYTPDKPASNAAWATASSPKKSVLDIKNVFNLIY